MRPLGTGLAAGCAGACSAWGKKLPVCWACNATRIVVVMESSSKARWCSWLGRQKWMAAVWQRRPAGGTKGGGLGGTMHNGSGGCGRLEWGRGRCGQRALRQRRRSFSFSISLKFCGSSSVKQTVLPAQICRNGEAVQAGVGLRRERGRAGPGGRCCCRQKRGLCTKQHGLMQVTSPGRCEAPIGRGASTGGRVEWQLGRGKGGDCGQALGHRSRGGKYKNGLEHAPGGGDGA